MANAFNDLKEKLKQTAALPAFKLMAYILQRFARVESTRPLGELVDQIKLEPSVTANVLRIANSAFFHSSHTISTVEDAVKIIGVDHLKRVVLATCVNNMFDSKQCSNFQVTRYWRDALRTAWCCEHFASQSTRDKTLSAEEFYITGLLLNIGLLALVSYYPKKMDQIFASGKDGFSVQTRLLNYIGFDQYYVSAELFKVWRFPEKYVDLATEYPRQEYKGPLGDTLNIIKAAYMYLPLDSSHDAGIEALTGIDAKTLDQIRRSYAKETDWIAEFDPYFG